MRLTRKPVKHRTDASIPLINIVFLLLLFFIVAGQVTTQPPEGMKLPASDFLQPDAPPDFGTYVTRSGDVYFDGRLVDIVQLANLLKGKSKNKKANCLSGCQVRIVVDHRLEAKELLRILKSLKRQGVSNIALATVKSTGSATGAGNE